MGFFTFSLRPPSQFEFETPALNELFASEHNFDFQLFFQFDESDVFGASRESDSMFAGVVGAAQETRAT